jgi:hypothetical protein
VVDDVGDLLGEQPRIDGVADGADAGDGVVQLEVAVAVPRQRCDAVAGFHAEIPQGVGETQDALVGVGIAVAVQAVLDRDGNDVGGGMHVGGIVDYA